MGTIKIQFRRERLENLPGVRRVDTSALNAVAKQDRDAARAIAGMADDIWGSVVRAGNVIAELKDQDNRNEANKLYKDYVTYMDSLTTQAADPDNPSGGKEGLFLTAQRDDNAARNLANDLRKAQADMRKAIGLDKQSDRVRQLFEEQAFSYDRGNALRADAIMADRFQKSRLGNAQAVTSLKLREVVREPNAESIAAYGAALTDLHDVQGLGENERALAFEQAQQTLLGEYLAQQTVAGDAAHTGALLGALEQDDILFPQGTDDATRAFMKQAWDKLPADAKVKVVTGLKAKRDAQAKEEIASLDNAQAEGTTTRDILVARRDSMRQAGVPEQILKSLNGVIATQTTKDINAAIIGIPDSLSDAPDTDTAAAQLEAYKTTLPSYVTDSNEWKAFEKKATRGFAKVANVVTKEDWEEQARGIVYGYDGNRNPIVIDPSIKMQLLTQMFKEGKLDAESLNKATAAIAATNDARCASIARQALDDIAAFRRAGAKDWGEEDAYKFRSSSVFREGVRDTGVDIGAITSALRSWYPGKKSTVYAEAADRFRDAYEGWARAVYENPSWTEEECQKMFYAAVRYPLEQLYEGALELDEGQFVEHQRRMHVLGMLGNANDERVQGNLDFDPTSAERALWEEEGELAMRARPNTAARNDEGKSPTAASEPNSKKD